MSPNSSQVAGVARTAPTPGLLNGRAEATTCEPSELAREILIEARGPAGGSDGGDVLERLVGQLHGVDPAGIEGDAARIAFWVNLYNALILHWFRLNPIRGNLLRHLRLFDRVAYRVGGQDYPLNVIENGVLRVNRRAPLRLRPPLRDGDPRLAAAPSRGDPRIHFALNCGAASCPPIRAYEGSSLEQQLELATRAYVQSEVRIERNLVRLPRLMRLYRADFGGRAEQLEFAASRLPELRDRLAERPERPRVRYGRFDWTAVPHTPAA